MVKSKVKRRNDAAIRSKVLRDGDKEPRPTNVHVLENFIEISPEDKKLKPFFTENLHDILKLKPPFVDILSCMNFDEFERRFLNMKNMR